MRLWELFGGLCARHGGKHAGRCDLLLNDSCVVQPDQFYYGPDKRDCLVGDAYYQGAPDVVAEVLSPASRAVDRGPRKDLYRRAGVGQLWLLDPEVETVEVYDLEGGQYRLTRKARAGEELALPRFPNESASVDRLFDTQWKDGKDWFTPKVAEPLPDWLAPPEMRLGLEALLLLGHPERRYEIWDNLAPCVWPCGSVEEALARFAHFVEDAARWEQLPVPALASGVEQAEVGRFRLTRRGRQVGLEVAVDARLYRAMADLYHDYDNWDWGEEDRPRRKRKK